jgi:hypothetical protein
MSSRGSIVEGTHREKQWIATAAYRLAETDGRSRQTAHTPSAHHADKRLAAQLAGVIRTLVSSGKGKAEVPGAERAVVELAKARDCLPPDTHSVGRHKGRVFCALGFPPDDPELCASELPGIVRDGELEQREDTPFGTMLLELGRRATRSERCLGSFVRVPAAAEGRVVATAVATRTTANGSR